MFGGLYGRGLAALVTVIFYVVVALSYAEGAADSKPVVWSIVDKPAAPFTLNDLGGNELNYSDLSGKVVLMDFWATWCSPCIKELPELAEFVAGIAHRDDVLFLSLNVTDSPDDLKAFAAQHNIEYPIYSGDELLEPYEVFAFPTKLILDLREGAGGQVLYRHFGFTGLAGIEGQIAKVLSE